MLRAKAPAVATLRPPAPPILGEESRKGVPPRNQTVTADAPLLKVGELRVRGPLQDDLSQQVNQLSFTPWHTTEDHRPLGNVMRARRVAYLASAALRGASAESSKPP